MPETRLRLLSLVLSRLRIYRQLCSLPDLPAPERRSLGAHSLLGPRLQQLLHAREAQGVVLRAEAGETAPPTGRAQNRPIIQ
jgi:hypothetical protein